MNKLLIPRSIGEDSQRREFILNVLLLASITIFAIALLCNLTIAIIDPTRFATSAYSLFVPMSIILGVLLLLFVLSRKGYFRISAYIIIAIFLLFTSLMSYQWSVGVTAALLIDMLVIVMAGVLISTRFSFVITALLVLSLFVLGNLQLHNVIVADTSWKVLPWSQQDTLMTCIIFIVAATLSWLSNRETERSLRRAHISEAALRAQRDSLELLVEERTRELKETQLEKISQLYSFAEFGRLSSGLFHDLMNPLSAVSLNVEKAKTEGQTEGDLFRAQHYLEKAFVAAQRMERFIRAVRKQIGKQGELKEFSLREEASQVIDILSYKAQVAEVQLVLVVPDDIVLLGEPVRFSQILLNLITNAIDAYDGAPQDQKDRTVVVNISQTSTHSMCTVLDHGVGIDQEHIDAIFEPFFTTKPVQETKGSGIGLSIAKTIIEKDFNGTVTVESSPVSGTLFTLIFPKNTI
ncbi:HAMP domain-containing histidine kinase [Patescibacteria group bacterium]|nr:HAMP domain-containing histidine kinase [Patescibacteria group bacterium]